MLNLSDNSVSDIISSSMSFVCYLATSGDKLYYTNSNTDTWRVVIYMVQHNGNSLMNVFYNIYTVSL